MTKMIATMGAWDGQQALPDDFVQLPYYIYAHDPFWLGEDEASLRAQFSHHNSWFSQGQAWLGVVPQQARLAGFFQPTQRIDGEAAAFFGFWESTNSLEANELLFAEFSQWAQQQGAKHIYGPINFTTFAANRLRLDHFERGAFPSEPWNPPYYPALLAQLGYQVRYRYLSTFSPLNDIITAIGQDYLRVKPKLEQHFNLLAMTPEFWLANLPELYGFVDEVFGANFAYTPISFETFQAHCGESFALKFCPKTSVLATTKEGRIAGFFLVYPDYSPLMRITGEHSISAAAINYAEHYRLLPKPRTALAKTGGVHPDFRAFGLFTAMSCELSFRARGHYEIMAGALVREDNASLKFAARHGTARTHQYALYQQKIITPQSELRELD